MIAIQKSMRMKDRTAAVMKNFSQSLKLKAHTPVGGIPPEWLKNNVKIITLEIIKSPSFIRLLIKIDRSIP